MALFLPDKYIWDFWLLLTASEYHIFYLQAVRTPYNPELRHESASVGHAVSFDLINWRVLPDALHAGQPGEWDDRVIWTGCVIEQENQYYLFYTSSSISEKGRVQRIGLALSGDLTTWKRYPDNPLLEADSRWYEKLGDSDWSEEAWRDPDIYFDVRSGKYYALICARENFGSLDGRGAIGLASSKDLLSWDVLPPACAPGEFAQMEVPQMVFIDNQYHILFSTASNRHSAARRARLGNEVCKLTGTYVLTSKKLEGGYVLENDWGLVADRRGTYYAGKIISTISGEYKYLATLQLDKNGNYIGALSDPMPVTLSSDGKLSV
jgi:beta-fructofuranosidase